MRKVIVRPDICGPEEAQWFVDNWGNVTMDNSRDKALELLGAERLVATVDNVRSTLTRAIGSEPIDWPAIKFCHEYLGELLKSAGVLRGD